MTPRIQVHSLSILVCSAIDFLESSQVSLVVDLCQSTLDAIQGGRDFLVEHFVKVLNGLCLSRLDRFLVLGGDAVGFPDMLELLVEMVEPRLAFRFDVLHGFHLTQSCLRR